MKFFFMSDDAITRWYLQRKETSLIPRGYPYYSLTPREQRPLMVVALAAVIMIIVALLFV